MRPGAAIAIAAAAPTPLIVHASEAGTTTRLHLQPGFATVLRADRPVDTVAIGDPRLVTATTVKRGQRVYDLILQPRVPTGTTNMVVWLENMTTVWELDIGPALRTADIVYIVTRGTTAGGTRTLDATAASGAPPGPPTAQPEPAGVGAGSAAGATRRTAVTGAGAAGKTASGTAPAETPGTGATAPATPSAATPVTATPASGTEVTDATATGTAVPGGTAPRAPAAGSATTAPAARAPESGTPSSVSPPPAQSESAQHPQRAGTQDGTGALPPPRLSPAAVMAPPAAPEAAGVTSPTKRPGAPAQLEIRQTVGSVTGVFEAARTAGGVAIRYRIANRGGSDFTIRPSGVLVRINGRLVPYAMARRSANPDRPELLPRGATETGVIEAAGVSPRHVTVILSLLPQAGDDAPAGVVLPLTFEPSFTGLDRLAVSAAP